MSASIRTLAHRLYSSAVAWSFVFTIVRIGGNLLVLPLMLRKLPPEDLGFWYVFLSLAGISSLVDMGFYPTMSRVTAFLWAGAKEIPRMGVATVSEESGTTPNYQLLSDLVKTMRLYYLALGLLVSLAMGVFGTMWIFSKAHLAPNAQVILGAWFLFLPALFVNTTTGMWHPLLSGINRVRLGQQIFVWGLVANYIVVLAGLLLGAGLFAPVAGYLLMGLVTRLLAQAKFTELTESKTYAATARWSGELLAALWPTAWRTGVVTLGIYATLNLGTLICAAYLGPRITASYGLSLQLAAAAVSLSTAFVAVKTPLIAQMRTRNANRGIGDIMISRMRMFYAAFFTLALAAVFFGEPVLHDFLHSRTPLLPTPIFAVLIIVVGLEGHHAIFRELTLTTHYNPFTIPVVIAGACVVLLTLILVPVIGVWALVVAPGVVQLCFNNWWTVLVGLRSIDLSAGAYLTRLFAFHRPSSNLQN